MASNYWMKMWIEVLDDPKMGRLSDNLWRRFFELCLVAKELNQDGRLPSISDMSWRLRSDNDSIEQVLDQLSRIGLVEYISKSVLDGHWFITNFQKRQAKMTSTERVRRHRKTTVKPRNESETNRYIEEETESEEEKENISFSLTASERQLATDIIKNINDDLSMVNDSHLSIVRNIYLSHGYDFAVKVLQLEFDKWCDSVTERGNNYNPSNPAWIEKASRSANKMISVKQTPDKGYDF